MTEVEWVSCTHLIPILYAHDVSLRIELYEGRRLRSSQEP
jgi:hypothetical protein